MNESHEDNKRLREILTKLIIWNAEGLLPTYSHEQTEIIWNYTYRVRAYLNVLNSATALIHSVQDQLAELETNLCTIDSTWYGDK